MILIMEWILFRCWTPPGRLCYKVWWPSFNATLLIILQFLFSSFSPSASSFQSFLHLLNFCMNNSVEEGRTEDKMPIYIHTYIFWAFYFFKGVKENISSNETMIPKPEGRLCTLLYSLTSQIPRSVFKYLQLVLVPLLLPILQPFTWFFVSLHWCENLLRLKQQFCCLLLQRWALQLCL